MRLILLLLLSVPLTFWLFFTENSWIQDSQAPPDHAIVVAQDMQSTNNTSLGAASFTSPAAKSPDNVAQILAAAMAEGKPMIHLVTVKAMKPFWMFICNECSCDICDFVLHFGYFAPIETRIFDYILTQGAGCGPGDALVVDAGANVGYFSLLAAAYGCRVAAFEPNAKARRYLEASAALRGDDRIGIHSQALSARNGSVELQEATIWGLNRIDTNAGTRRKSLQIQDATTDDSDDLKRRKLLRRSVADKTLTNITTSQRSFYGGSDEETYSDEAAAPAPAPHNLQKRGNAEHNLRRKLQTEVETVQLDSVVNEKILLFKIDTEGFEPHVLAGSMAVIRQHGVDNVVVEVKNRGLTVVRETLWRLMTEGNFTFVYNYQEFYLGKRDVDGDDLPIQSYDLRTENLVDVSDVVLHMKVEAAIPWEDFWFTKLQLPWLTPG